MDNLLHAFKDLNMTSSNGETSNDHYQEHDDVSPSDEALAGSAEVGDEEQDQPSLHVNKEKERKRHQKVGFDDWFAKKSAKTDVSKVKVSRKSDKEELQSLKDMLHNEQSGHMIIGSERAYQIELFEKAKANNTIAVLDTGSGKTLIAVLLLKDILENEIEDRAAGKPRKLAFFLVDKVALMLQQYAVLTANLRFRIDRLSGDMSTPLGDEGIWRKFYISTDVIVCTADVLLHALMRSFVKMETINLLIFDEVHHAKKGHTYARICNEFYKKNPRNAPRPRIFGMTASPVDTESKDQEGIRESIVELENTTQCRIATTKEGGQLRGFVHRPDEEVILYNRPPPRFDSYLFQALHAKYWDLEHFDSLFKNARSIKSELGPWCSDQYWSFAFSEKESRKVQGKVEREAKKYRALTDDTAGLGTFEEIQQLRQAHIDISDHKFRTPQATIEDLSDKVLELHGCLARHFERPTDARCLVFVNERVTARLLNSIFAHLGTPHLKPGVLLGSMSNTIEESSFTFKSQFMTLMKFKSGELNCIFATTVAEEGLDVPDCNLVIRFDQCKTMIQYIQSRGRARHQNSKMYHFLERSNTNDEDRLEMIWEAEKEMRRCFEDLPEDRLLLSDLEADEDPHERRNDYPVIVIPSTEARLTFEFSLSVLHNYVDSLPRDEDENENMVPMYHYSREGAKFRCEVTLPERTGLSSIVGHRWKKKKEAKMSAAFEACKYLRKERLLDKNWLPTRTKQLHIMRQARLAVTSKKQFQYPCQRKPSLWAQGRGTIPETLYLTVLCLPNGWDRPVRTFGLLTRNRLPDLPSFPLFQRDGRRSDLHPISIGDAIPVTPEQISHLTWFLLTVWKDLYNKTYEENDAQMSYWLAPLNVRVEATDSQVAGGRFDIDWDILASIHGLEAHDWQPTDYPSSLVDRFFVDPFDGGRRLYTLDLRPDMQMDDPVPKDVVPGPRGAEIIIDYSCSLWRRSKERRTWQKGQPVIEADKIVHRLNILSEPSDAEKDAKTRCFVCPEPLKISMLPADVAAMGYLYPGIVHRIESYLIALEFAQVVHINISPALALEAITKDSDNSDDADAEKINFQRGMGPNYERLEFIGDCFLKMATSLATYIRQAGKDEYWMHVERMTLLCNANLFEISKEKGYPKYVRSLQFSRRTWYPEAIKLVKGKGADKTDEEMSPTQGLGDKTIADVCEAMIGAALISNVETGHEDMSRWNDAVRAVTEFVWTEKYNAHDMKCWADYHKAYELPNYQIAPSSASELDATRQVEQAHDYHFRYPKLLQSAFTHPSTPRAWSSVPNYQRLEFLGDSLLDMTADMYLYKNFPRKDPQWLTEHKEAMVSNKFLGTLAASLGFNRFLAHSHAAIEGQMTAFIEEFRTAKAEANGAIDFWTGLRDPPKCLADMVEAYAGAVFIDSSFSFSPIQRFFDAHILPFFTDMTVYDTFANNHPINHLRDVLETRLGCSPTGWSVQSREKLSDDEKSSVVFAAVMVHGRVLGEGGVAKTGRVAKALAAREAGQVVEGLAPFEFREMWGCDCQDGDGGVKLGGEGVEDIRGTAI